MFIILTQNETLLNVFIEAEKIPLKIKLAACPLLCIMSCGGAGIFSDFSIQEAKSPSSIWG